jgi:hypothetical protein
MKKIITVEIETHTSDFPQIDSGKVVVGYSRVVKVNGVTVFEKHETAKSYTEEKSILKDFTTAVTPTGIIGMNRS